MDSLASVAPTLRTHGVRIPTHSSTDVRRRRHTGGHSDVPPVPSGACVRVQVDFYRRVVFRRGLVKRGAFIEDRVGNEMLGALRTVGVASTLRYGCWIHDDGLRVPMVKHNHGRAFITRGEKRGLRERAAAGRAPCSSSSSSSSRDGEDGVAVAAMCRLFGGATVQDRSAGHEGAGVAVAAEENIGSGGR